MAVEITSVRLDKWLWASRFFKTRKDSVEAINGGKVHLNGARVKPSRNVQINDQLQITRNNEKYIVTVLGLNDKRRPAKEAQVLFEEDEMSIEARESEREIRRINNASVAMPSTKPNKKNNDGRWIVLKAVKLTYVSNITPLE